MSFRPKAKSAVGTFRGGEIEIGKGGKTKPRCLSVRLQHGDIVVMHGSLIQKYYEVSLSQNFSQTYLV